MVNPDGVARGHYRTDTLAQNLNRYFRDPSLSSQPAVYSISKLIQILANPPPSSITPTKSNRGKKAKGRSRKSNLTDKLPRINKSASVERPPSRFPRIDTNIPGSMRSNRISKDDIEIKPRRKQSIAHLPSRLGLGKREGKLLNRARSDADRDYEHCALKGKKWKVRNDMPRNWMQWRSYGWREEIVKGSTGGGCRLWGYCDLHAHASKRSLFMYGNHFAHDRRKREIVKLFGRVMELNCSYFSYASSNFSPENMQNMDKHDGLSKDGSGRVAVQRIVPELTHCYTFECSYNTAKKSRELLEFSIVDTDVKKEKSRKKCRKYNRKYFDLSSFETSGNVDSARFYNIGEDNHAQFLSEHFNHMGAAIGQSFLDVTGTAKSSRLPTSTHRTLAGLLDWIKDRNSPTQKKGKRFAIESDV
ncbi:hypothetical protein AAMO2058_001316900 [Amorphochlora amoebiformis]